MREDKKARKKERSPGQSQKAVHGKSLSIVAESPTLEETSSPYNDRDSLLTSSSDQGASIFTSVSKSSSVPSSVSSRLSSSSYGFGKYSASKRIFASRGNESQGTVWKFSYRTFDDFLARRHLITRFFGIRKGLPLSGTSFKSESQISEAEDQIALTSYDNYQDSPLAELDIAEKAFGYCNDPRYRADSTFLKFGNKHDPNQLEAPYWVLMTAYLTYIVLIIFGHCRDFFDKRTGKPSFNHLIERNGYSPLTSDFDSFYVRRLKVRLDDCFNRPVSGVPGRIITLIDRETDDYCNTFRFTGSATEALNLSSYNYLGFAQANGSCADDVQRTVTSHGLSAGSPRMEAGTTNLHTEVENTVAEFVGKESAMIISMGFATNSTTLPALVSRGCLLISDEFNHASVRFGARLSGAMIRMFKHNDMTDLDKILKEAISQGQPRTHRPWRKILVVVEGLYSMEGTLVNLPGLVALKERYKFYIYLDEAHSIGALGARGRGVCDYYGIDPGQVDILMGTFTKSFGASGGYISGNKAVIDRLRLLNHASVYSESISPAVLQQIQSALRQLMGPETGGPTVQGQERLRRLTFNARYLWTGLTKLGFVVHGNRDSPVIPVLLYHLAKLPHFSREMLKRKIAVVVVGYPATPLLESRVRFCVSASHTKADLDHVLRCCSEVGDMLKLKYRPATHNVEDVIRDTPAEVV